MKTKMLFVVMLIGALQCFADVVRTEYTAHSRQQAEALHDEHACRQQSVWFPCAVSLTPHIEFPFESMPFFLHSYSVDLASSAPLPAFKQWISPFRLNIFAGKHLDVYGLDIGGIGNFVTGEFGGLQVAGVFNDVGETCASLQIAGVLNNCHGTMKGLQFGAINLAEKGVGCQIGVVNYATDLQGLQVGALNIIRTSVCPALPVLNLAF